MKVSIGALIMLPLFLAGCTGTYSTAERNHRVYAVTRQQALQIVDDSVKATLPAKQIQGTVTHALSSAGRFQFLFISTNIHAVALPLKGTDKNGQPKEGYGFIVTYWGNVPFPQSPGRIYRLMEEKASPYGEPLMISREEEKKARLNINYLRLLRP